MQIESALTLETQIEMVNAEIEAGIGQLGFGVRLMQLRKKRDALQARLDAEIDAMFESERGHDEDGCEEYARRCPAY